ncbi:MAG: permease [Anaerolineae bacterium]|nr:permease [Anaerolineae bacterium]
MKKFDPTPYTLAVVGVVLAGLAWRRGGLELALEGLRCGGQVLWRVLPLLLFAFLIAGLVQSLVTRELITRWLGSESGWRGIALACLGGALIPGGPYVYFPIAGTLFKGGASLGVLIAFVAAKNLWSVSRLPVEFALLEPRVVVARIVSTVAIPPLMGFLAEWLFGRHVDRVRGGMPS